MKKNKSKKYDNGGGLDPIDPQKEVNKQYKFLEDLLISPLYKERLIEQTSRFSNRKFDSNQIDGIINNRKKNLKELKPQVVDKIGKTEGEYAGIYFPKKDKIVKDKNLTVSQNPGKLYIEKNALLKKGAYDSGTEFTTTPSHEISHGTVGRGRMTEVTNKMLSDFFPKGTSSYMKDPLEVKGRVDAIRYLLMQNGVYDARKEKFTKEVFNKIDSLPLDKKMNILKDNNYKDLLESLRYNKDKFEILMNSIADSSSRNSNTQIMKNGGALDSVLPVVPSILGMVNPMLGAASGVALGMYNNSKQQPVQSTSVVNSNPYGFELGGKLIGNEGAMQYSGASHALGGIPISNNGSIVPRSISQAEVEDGETIIEFEKTKYIFSNKLKIK